MVSYYVDNNETIYAVESARNLAVSQGQHSLCTLGLADLTGLFDLSGQSTWLINRIHFFTSCFVASALGLVGTSYAYAQGGICPNGTLDLVRVEDYQGLNAWPLRGVNHYMFMRHNSSGAADDNPANCRASFSKTWTPSRGNHLALNRGQEISFTTNNVTSANDMEIFQSIIVEGRRGQ